MEIGFAFSDTNNIHATVANEIRKFFENTFIGLESALYKTISDKSTLTSSNSRYYITSMTIDYLNSVYKSLVVSDDMYLLRIFRPISQVLHHSEICVLNMLASFVNLLLDNFNRSLLKSDSYEDYMASVKLIIETNPIKEIADKLEHILSSHFKENNCTGENIRDQDPSKPLFIPINKSN